MLEAGGQRVQAHQEGSGQGDQGLHGVSSL
jgi:hypothetical protein